MWTQICSAHTAHLAVLGELEVLVIAVWTALVRCELAMIGEFGMVLEDFSRQETPVLSMSDCGAQITERFFYHIWCRTVNI